MTTTSMCARLTGVGIVKYPREKRIEFSQQTNSFCVMPSNESE